MGDLRDQLRKAKLLSGKQARRLAHEERVHRKQAGRAGLETERRAHEQDLEELRAQQRASTAAAQQQLDTERALAAERSACLDILRNDTRRPRADGGHRWYFELADGQLPWIEIGAADQRALQSGAASVVRVGPPGSHVYALLAMPLAVRVHGTFPGAVVWAVRGALES